MKEKELQLVTFEQAKKLEALGFDWKCNYLYIDDNILVRAGSKEFPVIPDSDGEFSNWNDEGYDWDDGVEKKWFSAPAIALSLKWMRDEKGINNSVCLCKWSSTTDGSVRIVYQPCIDGKLRFEYNVYEAAERALLDEILTILEKEKERLKNE
jgi:hypothetical protein